MLDLTDRRAFLKTAFAFEGILLIAALFVDYFFGFHCLGLIRWDTSGLAWGLGATLPLIVLFLVSLRFRPEPIARIHGILEELLAPSLAACRWYDLIAIAFLAGLSEELLFRGAIQVDLLELWGQKQIDGLELGWKLIGLPALLIASILFGLAHAITPTYAILAALIGVYLGVLMDISGERNLTAPILTHALYDYLAFLVVIRRHRSRHGNVEPELD